MVTDQIPHPDHDEQPSVVPTGFARWSELLVAAGVIVIGIVILVQTQDIRVMRTVQVSPRIVPQIVGTGMILVGLWYGWDIYRKPHVLSAGEDDEDVDITADVNWRVLIAISAGLLLSAVLMRPGGFIVASAALFTISSTAMGSRNVPVNALIGVVLGTIVYFVFDSWLGVRLPSGILGPLLD